MPSRGNSKLDWDKLRVFHAVAEAGSFTHASETLNLSQSAVSRQISALEASLGVMLFHRHARGLILTEQGDLLYKTVHDVFAKLTTVESQLTETKDVAEGPLTVTTTVAFGSVFLTGRLRQFINDYPGIDVTLRLDDRELDLAMREGDVAIRFNEPKQPDLIQRHLGSLFGHVFASADYLKEHGTPTSVEDLKDHKLVVFGGSALPFEEVNWHFEKVEETVGEIKPVLRVNSLYGVYRAVKSGIGIGALPEYFYREGRGLVQILPELSSPPIDAYFVYPEELRNSMRVSVFRDFLLKEITRARTQLTIVPRQADELKTAS
ncbi:MAG: LysR family transcriptional regulator [Rhodospirillaceae bacterium]|jgi:DNA-binding transcriptional LysR family regulator|nr:LysR family transcriptional regulator [Rhodospirillaceae bacterium]MBT5239249.1 LysR family transcriptional regulator [Rhodospirillaceae bacterium]MBT5566147.1 LysR family transcriptional regulator [Rhodospirillaceae bacterium]MBT6090596.1 LysR family transcriptional regulator [Rhodospirillaceae bacterium]MBT7451325.1 LysR family transcriptional regulator [Rhodospirillaceae bacterium]